MKFAHLAAEYRHVVPDSNRAPLYRIEYNDKKMGDPRRNSGGLEVRPHGRAPELGAEVAFLAPERPSFVTGYM